MNYLLSTLFVVLLSVSILSAKSIKNVKILNLENAFQKSEEEQILKYIEDIQPDIIHAFNQDNTFTDAFYQKNLSAKFPFVYMDTSNTNLIIFSLLELEHLKIHDFGYRNFILETASNDLSYIIFNGHLPNYTISQIDSLKNYLMSIHPYTPIYMMGDLNLNTPVHERLYDFCSKGDYGISANSDSEGNKSVKGDYTLSSDDDKFSVSAKVEVAESKDGEKKTEACIEIRGKH